MDRDRTPGRAVDPGAFYRGMFQHPDIAFFVVQVTADGQFLVEDGNKALENWLGRTIESMKGLPIAECLPPLGVEFLESNLRIAIEKRESHNYDRAIDVADGTLSWSTTLIPVIEEDGPVSHVLGMVRDIAHEKLAGQVVLPRMAPTDQRYRLAETLHMVTGQHLAAAHLALMRLEIFAAPHESDRGKELDEALRDARAAIDEIKREIGVLTHVLSPPPPELQDLGEALRTFVEGFRRRSGTAVNLRIAQEADRLAGAASRLLFQIVQEALANVHLHAHATKVAVSLDVADERIVLTVEDDGVGLAGKAAVTEGEGGLARMRARVAKLGGTFEAAGRGAGVRIVATLPMAADAN